MTRAEREAQARWQAAGVEAAVQAKRSKTHCVHGHRFTEETTYITPDGWRRCRICRRAANARSAAKHRDKHLARKSLNTAVERGWIEKPDHCERCGESGRIEGHHADYTKRREVEWLCAACHHATHAVGCIREDER